MVKIPVYSFYPHREIQRLMYDICDNTSLKRGEITTQNLRLSSPNIKIGINTDAFRPEV